jgi:hypothetical protein
MSVGARLCVYFEQVHVFIYSPSSHTHKLPQTSALLYYWCNNDKFQEVSSKLWRKSQKPRDSEEGANKNIKNHN